ncbi:MAG: VOC family protein [Halieaceae bacterium]|jgi:catechol 2,3-dioxygenase-like lactoylglutathione lyase family enzyme|nr:VOC family protein [Halieaceae bacterium]
MISGINHITFAVSDLHRSLEFYRDILGCTEVYAWDGGAYLEAGDIWLCLSVDSSAAGSTDYTHVAFDVPSERFSELTDRIISSGAQLWKQNRSEGDSLYFCCPDGHRLEIHVGDLESRLGAIYEKKGAGCGPAQ